MELKRQIVGLAGPIWEMSARVPAIRYLSNVHKFHIVSPLSVVQEAAKAFYGWDGNLDSSGKAVLERMCIAGRSISRDYWLFLALMRVPQDITKVAISDIFFEDELDFVSKSGGLILFFPHNKDPEPDYWEEMSGKYDLKKIPQGISVKDQESVLGSLIEGFYGK